MGYTLARTPLCERASPHVRTTGGQRPRPPSSDHAYVSLSKVVTKATRHIMSLSVAVANNWIYESMLWKNHVAKYVCSWHFANVAYMFVSVVSTRWHDLLVVLDLGAATFRVHMFRSSQNYFVLLIFMSL